MEENLKRLAEEVEQVPHFASTKMLKGIRPVKPLIVHKNCL